MQFDTLLTTLQEHGKSGQAYEKTAAAADQAMTEDPERAVAYRLLCALAERFLDKTGRLPVTFTQTEAAYEDFEEQTNQLKEAYTAGNPDVILHVLNAVAAASRQPIQN